MDSNNAELSPGGFKITCKNYPSEFNLDKNIAKEYFKQFGKLKRVIFKPRLRICTVEYGNKDSLLQALNNAGDYNGTAFEVSVEKPPDVKRKKASKRTNPIYLEDKEIMEELEAMAGKNAFNLPDVVGSAQNASDSKSEKVKKPKKSWKPETVAPAKKRIRPGKTEKPRNQISKEQIELINLVLSQATTIEEKYNVLDARDKLLRVKLKKNAHIKSGATAGTCSDMCPEKERVMRVTKHQVALYEQEDNGKMMNYNKAIKQYSRSSADQEAPLPHELRPVPVLQMTMCYLMHNIVDLCDTPDVNISEWYHFLWDRTRGIRKDITQQELCCQGSVELVEQCARFHIHCSARLVGEEPSVFDQKINTENLTKCLQSLKYMYHDLELKGEFCPNEAEFRAYIILLNLNDGNFMWEVQQLRGEIQKSPEVQFALKIHSAIDKNNYVKFFKLVYSTTYLNACILMRYFIQVRATAIKILLKCYSTRAYNATFPLSEFCSLLGFDDLESAIDFIQCYGLSLNEEQTHIVLGKNTFAPPEMPYLLDRSLNVVESKRIHSVGRVMCGQDLPAKSYENHILQNSFDPKGFLVSKDFVDESDLEQVKLNLYAELDEQSGSDSDNLVSKEPLPPPPASSSPPIFSFQNVQPKENIFSGNIFTEKQKENISIFGRPFKPTSSIFGSTKESTAEVPVFALPADPKLSNTSVFSKPFSFKIPLTVEEPYKRNTTSSIFSNKSFVPSAPVATVTTDTGGFSFNLSEPTQKPNFTESSVMPIQQITTCAPTIVKPSEIVSQVTESQTSKEMEKQKEEERAKRELEDLRKKELEFLERRKQEQERLLELNKRKQEESQRRIDQLRKEKILEKEIKNTVRDVLNEITAKVDRNICNEKISKIRNNIQRRKILKIFKKWRDIIRINQRKRKAMDCSPVWLNTKTLSQSATELHSSSQDLTLALMKRYKYGKPLDIGGLIKEDIPNINLVDLTYATLSKRFFDLTGKLQKSLFWKVVISLPDENELVDGIHRIEETVNKAFKWKEKNGDTTLIDHIRLNSSESVTYCVEKQQGMLVKQSDANGIIFIAKDFNSVLQRRIFENLKGFGVFTKVPIVIILQEFDQNDCKLKALIDAKIISDYVILIENLNPHALVNLVEESLIFLASKVEKPPPLELDTFYTFIERHLCTEVWKKASSFAKWNTHYKTCLRDPNTVINLYNDGLSRLKKIILNKSWKEYSNFPEVFREYLRNEIPDCLPCNYCYFPKFWKSELYTYKLEKILKELSLPKWQETWPPSSEFELEVSMSKYCTKAFKEPEKPFYRSISILLRYVDPNVNFDNIAKVLWTDVIVLLGMEKLKQINLNLSETDFENKSIFNQYIVVYNFEALQSYMQNDWFYINNPFISKYIKDKLNKSRIKNLQKEQKAVSVPVSEDIDDIFEATNQLLNKSGQFDHKKIESELKNVSILLNDLENSISIHKKISCKIEENLRRTLEEN